MSGTRHRWVRLREHVYVCKRCGTGKVNAEKEPGWWVTTYHCPNGFSAESRVVPPCEPGPKTVAALAKYADVIAAGGVPKEARS